MAPNGPLNVAVISGDQPAGLKEQLAKYRTTFVVTARWRRLSFRLHARSPKKS